MEFAIQCASLISYSILFVADVFHPSRGLTGLLFHNRDVCYGRRWGGAVPMLLTRLEPNHVSRLNLLDWFVPTLYQARARGDNQGLPQWMTMPGCPRTRLESDIGDTHARRSRCLMQWVNTYIAGKPLSGSFARGL